MPSPSPSAPAPPQPLDAAWVSWCEDLERRVQSLADQQQLTVLGPEGSARPCKPKVSLGKRLLGQTYVASPPWIRVRREDQLARLTCVANDREIGFPLTKEEEAALAARNWRPATFGDGAGLQRWVPDDVPSGDFLPDADAARLAREVALTFRDVFALPTPDDLRVTPD